MSVRAAKTAISTDPAPPPMTFAEIAAHAARIFGDREALVSGTGRWTFAALSAATDRLAKGLIATGVARGDRVAIHMPNCDHWILAMLAVARAGATLVPVHAAATARELAEAVESAACTALIVKSDPGKTGVTVGTLLPVLDRVIDFGEPQTPAAISAADIEAAGAVVTDAALGERVAAIAPDDPFVIVFTSGTTGRAKGIVHSHAPLRLLTDRARRLDIGPADAIVNFLPLSHLLSLSDGALMPLLTGARHILLDRLDPGEVLQRVEDERATILMGYDSHYAALLRAQSVRRHDTASLRLAILPAGLDRTAEVARQVSETFCPTISGYGMSETWALVSASPSDATAEQRCRASGLPFDGIAFRIADLATGRDLPPDHAGEILVRGHSMMTGYYGQPEETRRAIDGDGWLHTGDLGVLRPDGHLKFVGRRTDMLKVGGENVSPAEVEAVLLDHPAVTEAAVVGVPDDFLGEAPVAVVTGAGADNLGAFCRDRLAPFKLPRHVVVVDHLPKTESGKVRKNEIRDIALRSLDELAAAGAHAEPGDRDDLEAELVDIWRQVLDKGAVGRADNFFDSGGDSLRAAELMLILEEKLSVRLPLSALAAAPTVEGLAAVIRADLRALCLVPIQTEGKRPPFFFVHPHGGQVLRFYRLSAALGDDQPFYALQARGLDGKSAPHARLEDMAADYVAEVKGVQPQGPYFLGGYCFGGMCALEMARQLRAKGEDVALVALVDTPYPLGPQHLSVPMWVAAHLRRLSGRPLGAAGAALIRRAARLPAVLWLGLLGVAIRRLPVEAIEDAGASADPFMVEIAAERAFAAYRPLSYDGRAVLICGDLPAHLHPNLQTGWRTLMPETFAIEPIAGPYLHLLTESHASWTAACLTMHLAAAQDHTIPGGEEKPGESGASQ